MSQKDVLTDRTIEYLESQHWHYDVRSNDDERFIAALGMNLHCRLSNCKVLIIVSASDIQAMAYCNIKASPDVYQQVVEYITRANYGLKIGKFEFDYSDGEVRYQTILSGLEGVPSISDIERVIDMSFRMMDRYGDGLVKNLFGVGNPEADIQEAEAPR